MPGYDRETMRDYMKRYRRTLREECETLLGSACAQCSSTEELQFDHIDPSDKLFRLSGFHQSRAAIMEELKKCQLLCKSCHIEKSSKETAERARKNRKHGKLNTYMKYKCRCIPCKDNYDSWYQKYRTARNDKRRVKQATSA